MDSPTWAAGNDHVETVHCFVENGAGINVQSNFGVSYDTVQVQVFMYIL